MSAGDCQDNPRKRQGLPEIWRGNCKGCVVEFAEPALVRVRELAQNDAEALEAAALLHELRKPR